MYTYYSIIRATFPLKKISPVIVIVRLSRSGLNICVRGLATEETTLIHNYSLLLLLYLLFPSAKQTGEEIPNSGIEFNMNTTAAKLHQQQRTDDDDGLTEGGRHRRRLLHYI